jgi:hypothetical protein
MGEAFNFSFYSYRIRGFFMPSFTIERSEIL